MSNILKVLATGVVIVIAFGIFTYRYWDYVANPWTRDGQVRAQVIQITPRVSGPIVNLPIVDNQLVKAGDLLFEIDPRTFKASLDQARANLDNTRDSLKALEKGVEAAQATVQQYDSTIKEAEAAIAQTTAELTRTKTDIARATELLKTGDVSKRRFDQAKADYDSAVAAYDSAVASLAGVRSSKLQAEATLAEAKANLGAPGDENAQLRAAKAAVMTAELDLEFTRMMAPVDGYITNLNLRLGDQAVDNQPVVALVDVSSYWVDGFFKETMVEDVREGDRAIVTLMSYPDRPFEGLVDSIGWGIAQQDGSTGFDLLPTISPTFEWIRLAQRIPVRVHLVDVPDDVKLRVGTTASVLVMTGTGGKGN